MTLLQPPTAAPRASVVDTTMRSDGTTNMRSPTLLPPIIVHLLTFTSSSSLSGWDHGSIVGGANGGTLASAFRGAAAAVLVVARCLPPNSHDDNDDDNDDNSDCSRNERDEDHAGMVQSSATHRRLSSPSDIVVSRIPR